MEPTDDPLFHRPHQPPHQSPSSDHPGYPEPPDPDQRRLIYLRRIANSPLLQRPVRSIGLGILLGVALVWLLAAGVSILLLMLGIISTRGR